MNRTIGRSGAMVEVTATAAVPRLAPNCPFGRPCQTISPGGNSHQSASIGLRREVFQAG